MWNRALEWWRRHVGRYHPARLPRKLSPVHLPRIWHTDVHAPGFSDRFATSYPADRKIIIKKADDYANLVIDFLGPEPVDLKIFRERLDLKDESGKTLRATGRIPWHFDVQSGRGWDPDVFYTDLDSKENGARMDIAWRLSRASHLVTMGQAFRLTHHERFSEGIVNQIDDWMEQNRYLYGINWMSSMEAAIRACNWMGAVDLIRDSAALRAPFLRRFAENLWYHGNFIHRHLDRGKGAAGLVGLFALGTALDQKRWKNTAEKKIKKLKTEPSESLLYFQLYSGVREPSLFDGYRELNRNRPPEGERFFRLFPGEEPAPSELVWIFGLTGVDRAA